MCLQGQYKLSLDKELPQILEAFKKFNTADRPPYRPTLSVIVCGKRHHTKFNATVQEQMTRNGNTLPGTVVDRGVTDIYNHDFFLQVCKRLYTRMTTHSRLPIYRRTMVFRAASSQRTTSSSTTRTRLVRT